MHLLQVLRFIINHPLNRGNALGSIRRFFAWQMGVRMLPVDGGAGVAMPFVNDTRLLVSRKMTVATANIYTGLNELEDMGFILHLLREGDLFVDIGSNVGTYTVLAAGVSKATCIAFEPEPRTHAALLDNIHLNRIHERVRAHNAGLGRVDGSLRFTANLGAKNHVVSEPEARNGSLRTIEVPIRRVDDVLAGTEPYCIKIDIEGFETEVIAGGESVFSRRSLRAVLMETLGYGARYGFDDAALHEKMLGFGFDSYKYDPFTRELLSLDGRFNPTGNTLYLRSIDEISQRLKGAEPFEVRGRRI